MNDIDKIINIIKKSGKVVFFGGAGVSTESGLKDFRSKDGLYNEKYKYSPEYMLSHSCFVDKPKEFFNFYRNKMNSLKYKPNITHEVLALLEAKGYLSSIITQNIDGFHTIAGSKKVFEIHGSILKNYCTKCRKFYDEKSIFNSTGIPMCKCGGTIKPDVGLYEEPLNNDITNKALEEIIKADTLIIGGTSLSVYPAASFINYFKGKHLILINKDITNKDNYCEIVIHDSIGNVFKYIKNKMNL